MWIQASLSLPSYPIYCYYPGASIPSPGPPSHFSLSHTHFFLLITALPKAIKALFQMFLTTLKTRRKDRWNDGRLSREVILPGTRVTRQNVVFHECFLEQGVKFWNEKQGKKRNDQVRAEGGKKKKTSMRTKHRMQMKFHIPSLVTWRSRKKDKLDGWPVPGLNDCALRVRRCTPSGPWVRVVSWLWNKVSPKKTWYNKALSLPISVVWVSNNPANRPEILPSVVPADATWSAVKILEFPLTPHSPSPMTLSFTSHPSAYWGGYKNTLRCRYANPWTFPVMNPR